MKKGKPWERLPKVPVIQENLDAFYRFVYERQMIWHRRFVEKESPPWTADPILRDYKFTNVYRELDRGTIWLMKNIVPTVDSRILMTISDKVELLWKIALYRLLNRIEVFEKIGIPCCWEWKSVRRDWKKSLRRIYKTEPVFNIAAYRTIMTHAVGKSKVDLYVGVLDALHKKAWRLMWDISSAKSLEEVCRILQLIPCVGPFIAYEIAVDLIHAKGIPFHEDDWVNPGPGCKVGLNLIFPRLKKLGEFQDAIHKLRFGQEGHFHRLGLDFPYYKGKALTLRNIEHSLCEFGKAWKLRHKCGKHRQRFIPKSGPELYEKL